MSPHPARYSRLARTFLLTAIALGLAPPTLLASNILTPAGGYATGFVADDYFTDRGVIGAFDVLGEQVAVWNASGVQILDRMTGGVLYSPGGVPLPYLSDLPDEVEVYNSFVTLDPAGDAVWVGFTTDGNLNDRIYQAVRQPGNDWLWTHKATLTGNFEMVFHGADAYASANPTASAGIEGTDHSIYLVDTSSPGGLPASTHDLIAHIGGFSAGLAFDPAGNLYAGSCLLDASWNSYGALYMFEAEDLAGAVGAGSLTLAQATKLSDLPHGTSDTEVDPAGHVLFTMKQYGGPNYVAMWDAGCAGPGSHYDVVAEGTGAEGNFLFFLKSSGDFTVDGTLYVGDADYLPYPGVAGITAVPEPSAIALIVSAAFCAVCWRRRRRIPY